MADAKKNPKYNVVPISSPTLALVAPSSEECCNEWQVEIFSVGEHVQTRLRGSTDYILPNNSLQSPNVISLFSSHHAESVSLMLLLITDQYDFFLVFFLHICHM